MTVSLTKDLYKPLIPSGGKDNSRGAGYVKATFNKYGVRSYAILVDHTTVLKDLPSLPDYKLCGFFSFDINMAGKKLAGLNVKLITTNGPIPSCDGWLIMSTSRAVVFGLNRALMLTGNENQIIVRLYAGQVTEITAYMDMFSGETETLVYINHYFNRKYGIIFPIDLRYTVCECDGTIRKAGQRIIPPGGLTVIDSRKMGLCEFAGYLWLELEVENLQTRIPPFIHFWADYFNATGLCRNHQSGFGAWPAKTIFTRAYMPIDPEMELTCSFYNTNDCEIQPKALLHYNQNGEEKKLEHEVAPIGPKHMSYQNISQLFSDISFDGVNSAYVLFTCNKPIHRPNHYLHPKGTRQFVNLNHQARGRACYWTKPKKIRGDVLKRLNQFKVNPCIMSIPLLNERFKIDSYLGLLSSTICDTSDFTFILRNEKGKIVFSKNEKLDGTSPQFINLNEYAREHGINIKSGTFSLLPREGLDEVPAGIASLLGFKHKNFKYRCFHPNAGKTHRNLPFYINARFPRSVYYEYSPLQTSDRFAPGVISEEFDSLYIVTNWSLLKNYSVQCNYQLEIIDASGRSYSLNRIIPPQGYDAFWLSEVLKEAGIASKNLYYTLWTKSNDTELIGYHFLYRKRDHALTFADTFHGLLLKQMPQISGIETKGSAEMMCVQILRSLQKIKKLIPKPLKGHISHFY